MNEVRKKSLMQLVAGLLLFSVSLGILGWLVQFREGDGFLILLYGGILVGFGIILKAMIGLFFGDKTECIMMKGDEVATKIFKYVGGGILVFLIIVFIVLMFTQDYSGIELLP